MKRSVFLFPVILCCTFAWAQETKPVAPTTTASSATQSPAPAPSGPLKVRGPENVAQQDPTRIVATINGQQITAEQANNLLKSIPADQKRAVPNLQTLLERIYMIRQLADKAGKLNLDQQAPWKDEIQLTRDNILAQAYMTRLTTSQGASADAAKQYYDTHPDEFEQTKLSGILVSFAPPGTPASSTNVSRTEDQARQKADDLEKKIKSGTDFATLARSDSDNQQSAARGGDLGSLTRDTPNVPADVKTAVFKLQPGQVSEPLRVTNGFYILKVDSRSKQPFDQVRANIVMKQELEKYKIQVKDPDFFSASNAPANNIPSLQRPAGQPAQSAPPSAQNSPKPQAQR